MFCLAAISAVREGMGNVCALTESETFSNLKTAFREATIAVTSEMIFALYNEAPT